MFKCFRKKFLTEVLLGIYFSIFIIIDTIVIDISQKSSQNNQYKNCGGFNFMKISQGLNLVNMTFMSHLGNTQTGYKLLYRLTFPILAANLPIIWAHPFSFRDLSHFWCSQPQVST